ncbi:MAG: polysaccharide lyase 8 family protein [Akkermansiaceae bacterium]|nr:polysaccharide lyase 8 family protein [Akkermansiaceae bacterium]
MKSRIFDTLAAPSVSASSIESLRASLQADGRWPDVDYSSTVITNWPPTTHLTRMRDLARAHAKPGSPLEGDAGLLADVLKSYDAWIAEDPTSTNWYHNQINTPQKLGETMILLEPELSSARKSAGLAIVARSYVPRSTNSGTNTGANRVDRAYASLMRGLLDNTTSLVSESFLAMGDTILVTTAEGIQPDQSFQQHGAQLYVQGYGQVYLSGIMKYVGWASGTTFEFDDLQRRVLTDFLLDGVQWFIRGNTADFTAAGRGLTREGQSQTAAGFLGALAQAQAVAGGYRGAEIAAFEQRLSADVAAGSASPATALDGFRHFWRSDSSVHHRPGFSVFLKTSSTRTLQPETGNGEGLKNLHLGDGVTLIQAHGNEYDDIMPVWNWRMLPGTTAEQGSYPLKPASDWGVAGTSTHAGGAGNGTSGVTSFRYSRLGVTALKSWFFLGDRMVALGSGIEAPAATSPVFTTVNQCLLVGDVTVSAAEGESHVFDGSPPGNLRWAHHDGIGYVFPTGANVTLEAGNRTGTWQSINSSQSPALVDKDVFSLAIDHGNAVTGGTYAYIVGPVADAAAMEGNPLGDVVVERNDPVAQAASDPAAGITAATFWTTGEAAGIHAEAACCVVFRQIGGHIDVSVSDPTQANTGELTLTLPQAAAGLLHADTGISVQSLSPSVVIKVDLAGSSGRTLRAVFYQRPHAYQKLEIGASADAFAYDGGPNTSYGTGDTLTAKLLATPNYTRLPFLRFEMPETTVPPVSASLKMSVITTQTPGIHALHPVPSGSWSEMDLTWNNRPTPDGPPAGLWLPKVGARVSVDVTSQLSAAASGPVEFAIQPLTRTNDGLTQYASRENSDETLRPVLEIMVPRSEVEIWRIGIFGENPDPGTAGDFEDPDEDGLCNLIEFVLGSRPDDPTSASAPDVRMENGNLVLSYRRSHASADLDVFASISDDLQTWTRAEHGVDGVLINTTTAPTDPTMDLVSVSIPQGGPRFVRLAVTEP